MHGPERGLPGRRLWTFASVILLVAFLSTEAFAEAAHEGSRELVINIPSFTLYVYENGVVLREYPIGAGRVVNPSKLGRTEIINEVHFPTYYPPDWYTKGLEPIPPGPDNPVGTRWLGLGFTGYGIHGTNEPQSIGKAASAGCIRMHNRDVEELAEMVGVGTPVTFLYQTLEVWREPVTGRPQVRVYRDIYRQGTNRLDHLFDKLGQVGAATGADRRMLQAILAEAAGKPRPVPFSIPTLLDGSPVEVGAVDYGGELLLPLSDLAPRFGDSVTPVSGSEHGAVAVSGRVVPGSFYLGDRAYAPLEPAAEAFGLALVESSSNRVALDRIDLMRETGERLAVRAYPFDRWLLLPVQELGRMLGTHVGWDPNLQAVIVDGKPVFGVHLIGGRAYLPHDVVGELLGVRIRWSPGSLRATLGVATIRISGWPQGETGFVHRGEIFIPLRFITEHLGYTLGWNQDAQTAFVRGLPIRGMVRDGRVYAPLEAVREVVPEMRYVWDEEAYDLTLVFDGPAPRRGEG